MESVVIVGAGQQGRIVRNILELTGTHSVLGFLDDAPQAHGSSALAVLGPLARWREHHARGASFAVAIGANEARARVFLELERGGARFVNAIHPRACIEPGVRLGANVTVGALAFINIGSTIGDDTIINSGAIVEHDASIGSHVHLAPGALLAGEVTVGDGVFIGIGATVRDRVRIPERCVIGAQANVVRSPPDAGAVYYGNPARLVRRNP